MHTGAIIIYYTGIPGLKHHLSMASVSTCSRMRLKSKILAYSHFALASCAQLCVLQMLNYLLQNLKILSDPTIGSSAKMKKVLATLVFTTLQSIQNNQNLK